MEDSKTALVDSLIIWLQTFNTPAPCRTAEELTTGAAMSQALHQIDPAWFTDGWLSRIKTDVEDNWRLKMNNLKKILQMVVDYYNEVLAQEISGFPLPDLSLVAEHADPVQLGRLLQLILGCAVRCEHKQEYIQIIMTLEESVQHVVMTAIQELLSKETMAPFGAELSGDLEQQLKKALEELATLLSEKESLAQRCQELDVQVNSELIQTINLTGKYMLIYFLLRTMSVTPCRYSALWVYTTMHAFGTVRTGVVLFAVMLGSIVWSCCGRMTVGLQSGLRRWSHCGIQSILYHC